MSGKIHPKKPVTHASGPTYTINDPAKFHGPGKTKGKTAANGVENHVNGPTLNVNSTHIPTMNADKPAPMTKARKDGKWFDPHAKSNPMNASDGHTTPQGYPLKTHYGK